ncbi:MAG: class I SAM-dependent methyltransferase [Candidatus Babeliales bacterium]
MAKLNKPDYGYDAPKVIRMCSIMSVVLILCSVIAHYALHTTYPIISWLIIGALLLSALSMLYPVMTIMYGSRKLKFRERDWLLSLITIQGDEQILDVGCGRGLLLLSAAKKLKTGKATGIDIWCIDDQTQNNAAATLENAQLEGVSNRIEVITADARKMPFNTDSFDIIISSWALHNISGEHERKKALLEIMRVLKPGGAVALMDIDTWQEYEAFFKTHNFNNVERLGPRYTFGNPTYIVKATKKATL